MKTPRTYLIQQLSSILAIVFLLTLGNSTDALAQFSTVINVPSVEYPSIGDFFVVESDTQINLYDGGAIGNRFFYVEDDPFPLPTNREVNIYGGTIGNHFDAINTVINMTGGSIEGEFNTYYGSIMNMSGGELAPFSDINMSTLNFSGGTIGENFGAEVGSTINISGGTFQGTYLAWGGSVTNISGGTFQGVNEIERGIIALQDSTLNFIGSKFEINGVAIESNAIGSPLVIAPSDYDLLSGTLLDGNDFTIDDFLNFVAGTSINLTVTIVPEPSSLLIAVLGCSGFFCRVRNRSSN